MVAKLFENIKNCKIFFYSNFKTKPATAKWHPVFLYPSEV